MGKTVDQTSYITVRARPVDVDDVYGGHIAGVHSKVLTSFSKRTTEAAATSQPLILRLLPLHADLLELEFQGMQPRMDKQGRQMKVGLRGMALYIWIAERLKPNYPDMTFMKVRDELSAPFIIVAREYWLEQRVEDELYGRNRKYG